MNLETILYGILLRLGQTILQAAPTLFIGCVVAAIMREVLGTAGVRRIFAAGRWQNLSLAWLLGMLLPVCSLGAIPILREMHRARLTGGIILAFVLTAPLFNPVSVAYGLTLSNPLVIFSFSLSSWVIVSTVGLAWDWWFPSVEVSSDETPMHSLPTPGWRRVLAVVLNTGQQLVSPNLVFVAIGLMGVALLNWALPFGMLQYAAEAGDPWAPIKMAAAATPAFLSPIGAMVQIAGMFEHGNSVGAAFVLLVLGAGINLGTLAWMVVTYNLRRCGMWLGLLAVVTVGIGSGLARPLYPSGVEPAGHTHAFDAFCFPFPTSVANVQQIVWTQLSTHISVFDLTGLVLCLLGMLLGIGEAVFHARTERMYQWLRQPRSEREQRWDRPLSARTIALTSLFSLAVWGFLGCYFYFPPEREVLEELKSTQTKLAAASASGQYTVAENLIPLAEDWAHKLTVSGYLRGRPPSPYRRAKLDLYLQKIEYLEHSLGERDAVASRHWGLATQRALQRLRAAYQVQSIE